MSVEADIRWTGPSIKVEDILERTCTHFGEGNIPLSNQIIDNYLNPTKQIVKRGILMPRSGKKGKKSKNDESGDEI